MQIKTGVPMKMKSVSGFTIMEIMIVIAIIAIMSSIATPNLRNYMTQRRLNGASRQIMSDLMHARMQSVSHNNNFRVIFNGDGKQYTILDDNNNDGDADSGEQAVGKNIQTDYPGVTFNSNNNPIFSPRGTASSLPTITVTNSGGTKTITVAITGRVKIN